MTTMTMTVPETVFSSIRWSPEEFIREMRIEAAAQWYAQSRVSQERAADIAGVTRAEFIDMLALRGIPVMQADYDEIMDEVNRA
jgi:predicted HTH domain antitoxin